MKRAMYKADRDSFGDYNKGIPPAIVRQAICLLENNNK